MAKRKSGQLALGKQASYLTIQNDFGVTDWSREQITKILADPIGPIATIPFRCKGQGKCPYGSSCVLAKDEIEKAKDGVCPIERRLTAELFFSYISHFGIGPMDFTDINLIWTLVRTAIHTRRFDVHLQDEGVLRTFVVGIDPQTGTVIENVGIHPALEGQEKMSKKTLEILTKMIATREDKLKATKGNVDRGFNPMEIQAIFSGGTKPTKVIDAEIIEQE